MEKSYYSSVCSLSCMKDFKQLSRCLWNSNTCFGCSIPTRVDVSETFSADQLSFRILSGLFQSCSLPENLWTALIQLWTALKTEIFRAKNQRWNSADFSWNRADNHCEAFWNSSYHSWFSPETTLYISEFCVCLPILVLTGLFCNFSLGKLGYYAFWIFISYCFSANTRSFLFRKLLQESSSLTISGNCDLIFFLQKIVLILFPQIRSRKPQILSCLEI